MKIIPLLLTALLLSLTMGTSHAQSRGAAKLKTGKEIYEAGCSGCHGGDGSGGQQSTIGFVKPRTYPDFTQCSQTTPEDNLAWKSVIRDGGPSRGFSPIMPSFGEALTSEQMDEVIRYMRGFCKERGWPRGEFNLPRALVAEKAFPENEAVVSTAINAKGSPGVTNEIIHEQRFGMKNQIEVAVPVNFTRPERGRWYGGVGDIVLGGKRVLFSNLASGSIMSAQGEIIFPSGNTGHGLGTGVPTFETFGAYAQLFPWQTFLQFQGGADLPVDTSKVPNSVFLRTAVGKSFGQNGGLGRLWSPMVEFLVDRNLTTGAKTGLDVLPEFQVTISKRQHVRFDVGLRVPTVNKGTRQTQVLFYLLWDWQDGRLNEGWK